MVKFGLPLVLLTGLLSIVAVGDNTLPGDLRLTGWIQDVPAPPGDEITTAGNALGDAAVDVPIALVAVVLLSWRRRFRAAALIFLANSIRFINEPLKSIFDSPRPAADVVRVTEIAEHHGFPSGHAMGSVLLFGSLFLVALPHLRSGPAKTVVIGAAAVLPLLTGFARIYVGAHWPSDVLGGYLWGIVFLALSFMAINVICARVGQPRSMGSQTGLQSPTSEAS